ncbi:hypothetical protein ACC673_37875, partial [Rhizobium ruizarguesonis]
RFVCKFVLLWVLTPLAWAADGYAAGWLHLPEGDSPWRVHGDVNLVGQFHDNFHSLYESTPDQGGNSLQSGLERSQTTML